MDLTKALLTDHARKQLGARQISESQLRQVLSDPQQVLPVRTGRIVAQGMLSLGSPPNVSRYLVRVFVDIDRQPFEVVTAYKTSKIDKYRSRP